MIRKHGNSAKQWSPEGFERFATHYPATSWQAPPAAIDRSERFVQLWHGSRAREIPPEVCVVLTPGLFAECLPQCFRAARREFESAGHRVLLSRVRTARTIRTQAQKLSNEILQWLQPGERFIWFAHSKGGLDALWALETGAELRARCAGAALVQVPVGHSWVIEKWWSAPSSLRERLLGGLLRRKLFAGGVSEISRGRDSLIAEWLEAFVPKVPLLHVVSWSQQATSWVDSYHRQLNAARPGHAHDGQFYLNDQRLPAGNIICLPELDHAQPVLGGHDFDAGRFWRVLLQTAWQEPGVGDGHAVNE